MDIFYTDFLNCLESLHDKIKLSIADLPQAGLDWSPKQGVGSPCMVISHIAGAERYWIAEVVGQEQAVRRAGTVYRVTGLDANELCKRLEGSLSYCRKVLQKFELTDLDIKRISPRDGQEVTVRWALLHVIEHTVNHQWDINFTWQLWEKRIYSHAYNSKIDQQFLAV